METIGEDKFGDISKVDLQKYGKKFEIKKSRGGINCPIAETRGMTADLLGVSFKVVCGLTRGWSQDQLYGLYYEVLQFKKNPAALWWKLYRERNQIYGKKKTNTKNVPRLGQKGRTQKQGQRPSLFPRDWSPRGN